MKLLRVLKAGWMPLPVLVCLTGGIGVAAAPWAAKAPRLATPWTWQVSVENPLPEYPRPKLTRPEWQSLNGIWDFAVVALNAGQPDDWPEQIRFRSLWSRPSRGFSARSRRTTSSGIGARLSCQTAGAGRRVQLNFGVSDWQTTVFVNNQQVGNTHTGGYDGFSYDITDYMDGDVNTIVVGVYDPTDAGQGAVGKQRQYPGGIFYTAASGIWQTVWLEPTPAPHLTRLDITPDVSSNSLRVTPGLLGREAQPSSSLSTPIRMRRSVRPVR